MQARPKTRLSCPKGPPPDAVHMSSKLVHPEPVQNTKNVPAAADTRMCIGGSLHWVSRGFWNLQSLRVRHAMLASSEGSRITPLLLLDALQGAVVTSRAPVLLLH